MGTADGPSAAAMAWSRADFRRRWKSLVVLGVLAGLTAGLAMASVAGSRRTSTAFPRLRSQTLAADAAVFPGQVGAVREDWSRLRARPYLTHLARWELTFGSLGGEPGAVLFIPADRHWLRDVDRPVVVDGRMFRRTAPDEVVVDEVIHRTHGIDVGDLLSYRPFGPTQDDTSGDAPNGPLIRLHVVGVTRDVNEFLFNTSGSIFVSPGFDEGLWVSPETFVSAERHIKPFSVERWVAVRWRSGVERKAALARFQRDISPHAAAAVAADIPVELTNLRNIRTLPLVLAVFLAALALSTLAHVLVASVRRRSHEFAVLRALGLTRRMTREIVSSQSTIVGIFGLVIGIPIGMAIGRIAWMWVASKVPLRFVSPITIGLALIVIPSAVAVANLLAALPGRRAAHLRPAEILRTE